MGAVSAFWARQSPRNRLVLALGAGAALVFFVALLALATRGPAYAPLFTNLNPQDAGNIVTQLESQSVPYRLTGNGRTIEVPEGVVHRTRLTLAQQGLPSNGVVGFEILARPPLGQTDFDKRVQYLRALQGELTRTILAIDGVQDARVHLNIPEPSVFVRDKRPASASILLKLNPGAVIDPGQVRGIVNLVAGTVDGLRPEAVTVLDQTGRLLTALVPETAGAAGGAGGAAANNNLIVQQDFQKRLEASLQTLLDGVLGAGNAIARVTAELNFDSGTEVQEMFRPIANGQGILENMNLIQETFRGTGGAAAPAGTASNTIPTMPVVTGDGTSDYSRTENRNVPVLDRISKQITVAPGAVKRLSVSVVVNRAITADEEDQLRRLVTAAVGLDANRSDQISVVGLPFTNPLADAFKPEPGAQPVKQGPAWLRYAIWGVAALVVLASFLLAMRIGRRRAAREKERLARELQALEQRLAQEKAAAAAREIQAVQAAQSELQNQVANLARQKPEEVAQILRTWLNEE